MSEANAETELDRSAVEAARHAAYRAYHEPKPDAESLWGWGGVASAAITAYLNALAAPAANRALEVADLCADYARAAAHQAKTEGKVILGQLHVRNELKARALADALRGSAPAPMKTYADGLRDAAKVTEGWQTEAAGDHYMTCGNGHFWDAGTPYDQGRADAAAAIRALIPPSSQAEAQ